MKQQKQYLIVTTGLFFALWVLFAGCSSLGRGSYTPTPPPPSAKSPSIYPGAQRIVIEPEGSTETPTEKRITFRTSDEPDKVLQYYRGLLLQEGWTEKKWQDAPANWVYYEYGDGPYYSFALKAEKTSAVETSVTLSVVTEVRID